MHGGLTLRFFPFLRKKLIGQGLLISLLAVVFFSTVCSAEGIDWAPWKAVPVYDQGRVMPLDTFARRMVRDICGRENPKLTPPQDLDSLAPPTRAAIERLFPGGQPRKFSAAELLYSWIAEPDVWYEIPILQLSNEALREELGLPIYSSSGDHLKHISPRDLRRNTGKWSVLYNDLMRRRREAEKKKTTAEETAQDRALLKLLNRQSLYRNIVFMPFFHHHVNYKLQMHLATIGKIWQKMDRDLTSWKKSAKADDPLTPPILQIVLARRQTDKLFDILDRQCKSPDVTVAELLKTVSELADESNEFTIQCMKARQDAIKSKNLRKNEKNNLLNRLVREARYFSEYTQSLEIMLRNLYDEGRPIRVVPGLNLAALKGKHDPDEQLPPWVSLQAVLDMPESMLDGFPVKQVTSLREAFEASKQDYLKIGTQDGDADEKNMEAFNASLRKFTETLRTLGESLTEKRSKLDLEGVDQKVLDQTAYPPPGAFDTELLYNRLDPFLWSWIFTLAALVFFALAWGAVRNPVLLLGLLLLILGQAATCYGLVLRMLITKMVPVTNMYETVLFVGLTTGFLTICVSIYPLLQAGMSAAWRLTAWPLGAEARSMNEAQRRLVGPLDSDTARWILFAVRVALAAGVIYFLAVGSYGPRGEKSALGLLPQVADQGSGGIIGMIILWIVGLAILAWTVWFIPRAVPTLVLSLVLSPVSWWTLGFRDAMHRTAQRRFSMIAGSAVALLIYLVGYFTPNTVFNHDVDSGMASILRNNFWLTIHVLIITASYGAGALAWGIGNIASAYYLFGRYDEKGAPKVVHSLANSIYRMMQVAILLLAAGTITGAIWADVAWGRYWGWDPKEVWALVTLLVYLAILHGRWARWIGDLGMAVGAVLGFTSIIMAWYGVNSIGAGLHYYGSLTGGFYYVLIIAAVNWVFVITAVIRYQIEKQERRETEPQKGSKEE